MNILIVKLSAIGDVIHALPVSYAIKETFPKARVTWAVEPPARELLVDNPYIDEILLFEKKKFKSFSGFRKHFGPLRAKLKAGRFGVALDLQGLGKSAAIAFFSGAPRRLGTCNMREMSDKISTPVRGPHANGHIVERYLDVARAIGCRVNTVKFPLVVSERDEQIARVEDYLMKKWGIKEGGVKSYADVFAEGSDLAMGGTGVLDAQGAAVSVATLTGTGGSVTNFSQLAVTDSIVLDVVNGVVSPLSLYGDVTFGTAANGHDIPVYIDDWRTLDAAHPSQRAVSVQAADGATPPTVTGTLHSADALRNWALTRSGNTWSVARTGLMLIFR